jgi:hypothetical protein
MRAATEVEVWPTETPFVVYIIPDDEPMKYAAAMYHLTNSVHADLGWEHDTIETVGLIATSPQHVKEGLYFLDEFGIDPRSITLLMMWGDTAEIIGFAGEVPIECGTVFVALPRTGVVLPVLRMPALSGDWWLNPLHQSYAEVSYAEMVREGRIKTTGEEHMVCIAPKSYWN